MRLTKFSLLRQISTYLLAIMLGALLTVAVYRVAPSQASPAPASDSAPTLLAQRQPPAALGGSFVTAAVNRVGPSVVRIDTERTVTRRIDPFLMTLPSGAFLGMTFPGKCRKNAPARAGIGFYY